VKAFSNKRMPLRKNANGFSLIELLVAVTILVIVAGAVMAGMVNTTRSQSTVMNRTQLHASVRNATELMEQEIGQAGRIASAPGLQITAVTTTGIPSTVTVSTTSGTMGPTTGMYVGEQLVVDPSTTAEETVTITVVPTGGNTITATFTNTHPANTPVLVLGGFASGIVPPDTSSMLVYSGFGANNATLSNGANGQASTGSVLKLYGDINGDGTMYYVVYKCTPDSSGTGTLYRYVSTDITTATTVSQGTLLLDNLAIYTDSNGNVTPCFSYQFKDTPVWINGGQVKETFVTNVAVTLTIQTQNKDAKTNQFQTETKALLNISPRNVFDAWELASAPSGYTRAQPMPLNVLNNGLLTANLNP
jgi:prepilin-type N-terminal cleavage/methylation domain-containing protein